PRLLRVAPQIGVATIQRVQLVTQASGLGLPAQGGVSFFTVRRRLPARLVGRRRQRRTVPFEVPVRFLQFALQFAVTPAERVEVLLQPLGPLQGGGVVALALAAFLTEPLDRRLQLVGLTLGLLAGLLRLLLPAPAVAVGLLRR